LSSSVDIDFLNKWVSDVLSKRAIKVWSPALFADPDTAEKFPVVDGLKVEVDATLDVHMLVIRNVEAFEDKTQLETVKCTAGEDMARIHWGIKI